MLLAQDIMSRNLVCITEETDLLEAYKLMKGNQIRHLPVIGPQRQILGILSDRDLLRSIHMHESDLLQISCEFPKNQKVKDQMTKTCVFYNQLIPLHSVVEEMVTKKISSVLLCNDAGKITGIITTEDLLRLLLQKEEIKKQIPHFAKKVTFESAYYEM